MPNDEIITGHYGKLARSWGLQGQMSMQDKVVRARETAFILAQTRTCLRELGVAPEQARVLDAGCGNGHLLAALWDELAGAQLRGMELVRELVELARSRQLPGVDVTLGDLREDLAWPRGQHVVITERSIVNLLSWEWQKAAFTHIAASLVSGGHYIMVESFHEPWLEMNAARAECGLGEIPVSPHNRYLKEACIDTLASLGLREIQGVEARNALSTHFFLSRVFQHLFTAQSGRPASERVWHFFSDALPSDRGNYSPILLRVFRKD